MKHVFLLIFLGLANTVSGQSKIRQTKFQKPNRNEFQLSYNPRLYLNNVNIDNDDVPPATLSNVHSASLNTNISLEYQRNTKYGLIYGMRFEFGTRSHNVNVTTKFSQYDTVSSLKTLPDSINNYQSKNSYIGLNVFLGYRQNLGFMGLKNIDVEGKIGVGKIGYINGSRFNKVYWLAYFVTDTFLIYGARAADIDGQFGSGGVSFSGPLVGNAYLGFTKKCNYGVIKSLNLGFTFTHRIIIKWFDIKDDFAKKYAQKTGEITVINHHRLFGEEQKSGRDVFNNKEMSFGIKLGIGFSFF